MTISSRTPEGLPNRCPLCQTRLKIEPSRPPGDAPCPRCGHLVWFDPHDNETGSFSDHVKAEVFEVVYQTLDLPRLSFWKHPSPTLEELNIEEWQMESLRGRLQDEFDVRIRAADPVRTLEELAFVILTAVERSIHREHLRPMTVQDVILAVDLARRRKKREE